MEDKPNRYECREEGYRANEEANDRTTPTDATGRRGAHHLDDGLNGILRADPVGCSAAAHVQSDGIELCRRGQSDRHTGDLAYRDARSGHEHPDGRIDTHRRSADGSPGIHGDPAHIHG